MGGDGDTYTGADPRLASGSGGSWSITTVLNQKGLTSSKKPLYACIKPALSVSPDGKEVIAACVEVAWQTDSIYNSNDVAATYTAKAVIATIK